MTVPVYNDKLDADTQTSMEEAIATDLADFYAPYVDVDVPEEALTKLSKRILLRVLEQFRPDLVEHSKIFTVRMEVWVNQISELTPEQFDRYLRANLELPQTDATNFNVVDLLVREEEPS